MTFLMAHAEFIDCHAKRRSGERLRRLQEGHSHAEKMFLEKVWWPAFGHFEFLHPEYEISDFRDGSRFLDFAFVVNSVRFAIEIDGYGPHLRQASRSQYSDERIRQNHIINDGWRIHRYSYDDIINRPRMCQQLLLQFIGRYLSVTNQNSNMTITRENQDIIRLAIRMKGIITPKDVCQLLNVEQQKARKLLRGLVSSGLLLVMGPGDRRIARYQLIEALPDSIIDFI